ncbi:hypothetical protein QJQ45_010436 [Haematococcus lacustris]|nr:hypothetical protein QJQ45_010436 [Haematococcus lacustris]
MKGKKRKGADGPKQPNPKQPKPKPKDKPDDLGWVGLVSPQGRARKARLKEAAKSRIQFVKGRNNVKNKIVAHLRLRMGIHHKQRKLVSLAALVLLAKCLDWTAVFAAPSELSGWKQLVRGPAHKQNLRQIPKAFFADPDNAAITAKLVELDKTELLGDSNTIGALAKQILHEGAHVPSSAKDVMRFVCALCAMQLEEEAASVSQQEWGTRKQLVVFFGNASIGTRGGWGAKAVLQACRKVVERANSGKPTDRVPGKVVTVDEFRTSRVSSILNSPQPCEEELDRSKPTRLEGWKPKPGQVQDRLLRSAWSKRFEAPVRGLMWCPWLAQATPGKLGKWVDRDCNAALNLQRAGESKWRPLELRRWQHRGRLPAQGKEYPALGFKKLRERAPKAQAQQPEPDQGILPGSKAGIRGQATQAEQRAQGSLLTGDYQGEVVGHAARKSQSSFMASMGRVLLSRGCSNGRAPTSSNVMKAEGKPVTIVMTRLLLLTVDPERRLVIVDEFRTSRVSSSVHALQPCELHLPDDRPRPADWVPPAGQVNHRLLRPAWSLRHAKCVRGLKWCHEVPPNPPPPPPAQDPPPPPPAQDQPPAQPPPGPVPRPQAPPWGRWLDRDINPCLNFQRIGESKQRPLELCSWTDLKALPHIGKEYQQGYKLVNDRLPKVKQRLHRAAEYRRGIDGRARNNAKPYRYSAEDDNGCVDACATPATIAAITNLALAPGCACSMVIGPNGAWWSSDEHVGEDMVSLPASILRATPGVYTIQVQSPNNMSQLVAEEVSLLSSIFEQCCDTSDTMSNACLTLQAAVQDNRTVEQDICSRPPNVCAESGHLVKLVLAGDASGNLVCRGAPGSGSAAITFPQEFGRFSLLESLDLSFNILLGNLSSVAAALAFPNVPNLKRLYLMRNNLGGPFVCSILTPKLEVRA